MEYRANIDAISTEMQDGRLGEIMIVASSFIPWLDPETIINSVGPWALVTVCAMVFAETGLLFGLLLPGDSLLVITGIFVFGKVIAVDIWWVVMAVVLAAALGGELGYWIGRRVGPSIFARKESGIFSVSSVDRTNAFFRRFGPLAVVLARFVPVVRTFAPVAAGVARMDRGMYSLYNVVGAILWGGGLTFGGYLLGNVPVISDFVLAYTDLIIVGAVLIVVIPTACHYIVSARRSRRPIRNI